MNRTPTPSFRRIAGAIVVVTASVALWVATGRGQSTAPVGPAAHTGLVERAASTPRLRCTPGTAARYALHYARTDTVEPRTGGNALEGELRLDATVTLACVEATPLRTQWSLRIDTVDNLVWTLQSGTASPTPLRRTWLEEGAVAFAHGDGRGALSEFDVPSSLHPAGANVLGEVLAALQAPTRSGAARWKAAERLVGFVAQAVWERQGDGTLHRTRTRIERAGGSATSAVPRASSWTFRLGDDGLPLRVEGREEVQLPPVDGAGPQAWSETLRLERRGAAAPARVATATGAPRRRVAFGAVVGASAAREEALRQRARGFTWSRIEHGLAAMASTASPPGWDRWLEGAVARLRLDPTLCTDVAAWALQPGTRPAARARAAELLVAAGTPAAQRALLDVLSDGSAMQGVDGGALLERLAFLRHPTGETTRFVESLLRDDDPAVAASAAVVAGSLAANLAAAGDRRAARALTEELASMARRANDAEARRALALGLGNAGTRQAFDALTTLATAGSTDVRRAVARAARHLPGDSRVELLAALVLDDDPSVRAEAIRAAALAGASPPLAEAITTLVEAGLVDDETALWAARALMSQGITALPGARTALESLASQTHDANLRASILAILRG